MSLLKELYNLIEEDCIDCEIVYVGENGEVLEEGARRAYKRVGREIRKMYRCTSGAKKGKMVSDPKICVTRKDPKKKRLGKKVMREKKGVIQRKSKQRKKQAISKLVRRMNARLSGRKVKV